MFLGMEWQELWKEQLSTGAYKASTRVCSRVVVSWSTWHQPPHLPHPPGTSLGEPSPLPACPASWIQGYFFLKDMTKGDHCTIFFIFLHDLLWKAANRAL